MTRRNIQSVGPTPRDWDRWKHAEWSPLVGGGAAKKVSGAKTEAAAEGLQLAAMGLEAEFSLLVDGEPTRPEDLFRDPRDFLGKELMHRVGTSYHLPTGGAVYFDTGVIEVATPVIEIERGCAARAGRSLWEGVLEVRGALDDWERGTGRRAALVGFSAHYNISFELPEAKGAAVGTIEELALLLSYIVPVPTMLLATNRRSTGVGVRPRGKRIEITVDFTPSPSLMIATATLLVGIAREVMAWPSYDLEMLGRMKVPVIDGYAPVPHTSRHGWLARQDCFPANPFTSDVDEPFWRLRDGEHASLRDIAERITRIFWTPISRISDPFSFRLIGSVMRGRAPSLLELPDRPAEYDDVGRLCTWDNLFPERALSRSLYERVLIRAISGHQLRIAGRTFTPVGMSGWSRVVFRDEQGLQRVFSIDYLLGHLKDWERKD